MKNLNIVNVMSILTSALDNIDTRIVDHGQRVAYMVYKMMQADGSYTKADMQEICLIATIHDIGAYKTEEIDSMAAFESDEVWHHSIYGHLFLKNMTPLYKWADVVLFHHTEFEKYPAMDQEKRKIAGMIHLADRIDMAFLSKEKPIDFKTLYSYKNIKFDEKAIDLFAYADQKYEMQKHIRDGAYLKEVVRFIKTLNYDEEILLGFIKMIAFTIDFRSETTVNHVVTTVSISLELGKILGLSEEELRKLKLGAYLHDIGKIATPLHILEKPSELTQAEFKIMREHILTTERILNNRVSNDVLQIAYRHHEKIDGSGYPQKLSGVNLNMSEKILAVADVMSALTGKRSYKDSFGKEIVVGILQEQSDANKLCPAVISAAISHYDTIIDNVSQKCQATLDAYNEMQREFNEKLKELEMTNK